MSRVAPCFFPLIRRRLRKLPRPVRFRVLPGTAGRFEPMAASRTLKRAFPDSTGRAYAELGLAVVTQYKDARYAELNGPLPVSSQYRRTN